MTDRPDACPRCGSKERDTAGWLPDPAHPVGGQFCVDPWHASPADPDIDELLVILEQNNGHLTDSHCKAIAAHIRELHRLGDDVDAAACSTPCASWRSWSSPAATPCGTTCSTTTGTCSPTNWWSSTSRAKMSERSLH